VFPLHVESLDGDSDMMDPSYQQILNEEGILPLLHKVAESWVRPSFLLVCGLLTHKTTTGTDLPLL
jgi:hypothetical protein